MKSVTAWLLNIFAVLFWIFRIVVLLLETFKVDFPIKSIDANLEIPLLFITVICLVFVFKRNSFGSLIYFAIYLGFFGTDIIQTASKTSIPMETKLFQIILAVIGIIIALANTIEIVLSNKGKSTAKSMKKTDWFFQNEQFDRELDERADKNHYRTN